MLKKQKRLVSAVFLSMRAFFCGTVFSEAENCRAKMKKKEAKTKKGNTGNSILFVYEE